MMNAINALSGVTVAETIQQYGYRIVLAHCIDECRAVFAAHNIPLQAVGNEMSNFRLRFMSTFLRSWNVVFLPAMGSKIQLLQCKCSMAQDLDNGVPQTEIEHLNGVVVQLGYQAGVPTPINTRILELVQCAEALQLGSPRLSPENLLAEVGLVKEPTMIIPGRVSRLVAPPALVSFDSNQEALRESSPTHSISSSRSSSTKSVITQKSSLSSLRDRVDHMWDVVAKSSSDDMMPYVRVLSPITSPRGLSSESAELEDMAAVLAPLSPDQSVQLWN